MLAGGRVRLEDRLQGCEQHERRIAQRVGLAGTAEIRADRLEHDRDLVIEVAAQGPGGGDTQAQLGV